MSMTGDFYTPEGAMGNSPSYPKVFGLEMTPLVNGVLMGLAGLVGTGAILVYFALPAWETYQKLDAQVKEKAAQVQDQGALRKQIEDTKQRLVEAKAQRAQVYGLFASEKTLNTLLLDLNTLIENNNTGRLDATRAKLNNCPAYIQAQYANISAYEEFRDKVGDLVVEAKLSKFKPSEKGSEVINDGSLGAAINGKLKRQTIDVEFRGNFNQTQSIFRTIERLQPLLLVKNLNVKIGDETKANGGLYEIETDGSVRFLTNCQPDTQVTTAFQMDALLPLSDLDRKMLRPVVDPKAVKP